LKSNSDILKESNVSLNDAEKAEISEFERSAKNDEAKLLSYIFPLLIICFLFIALHLNH